MKKCAVWTAAVVVTLVALCYFVPKIGSYVALVWDGAGQAISSTIPPEVEIARLKKELDNIDGDMQKSFGPVAEQMTKVDKLRVDVKDSQARLDQEKKNILAMKADLESGAKTVAYRGNSYSGDRATEKLATVFQTYKIAEQGLANKQKLLKAEEENLTAAKERLDAMRSTKEQLKVELASLEADLQNVRLAETKSKVQVDDSRLSRINADMKALRDRVATEKNALTLNQRFVEEGTVQTPPKVNDREVLKDIDEHFNSPVAEQK